MKERTKLIYKVAVNCIIFAVCAGGLTTLTHMLCSRYILHEHGRPEFLSTSLILYSCADKILMALGYYLLGRKIPVKNPVLRSLTYIGLHWISNFLPQFMGLAFADGPIASIAFRMTDLACDTLTLIVSGVILGMLYRKEPCKELRKADQRTAGKAIAVSAILFPVFIMAADQFMAFAHRPFSSVGAMQVSDQAMLPFFVNFYSWFLLSGAFICVFYILTEYNDNGSWLRFALKYSLLLWTPVVMIMVLFGTDFIATSVYALIFIVCILIICFVANKILSSGSKDRN